MKYNDVKLSVLNISVALLLLLGIIITGPTTSFILTFAQEENKKQIILTAILDDLGQIGKKERWQLLFKNALSELKARHPGLDIKINLIEFPGNESQIQIQNALTNRTPVDIVSIDQIWLVEFAEKGLLTDLTNYTNKWGRQNDWYEVNWDGGAYNDNIYGIWAWTDVRGIWYWKDLLKQAGIEPESLKTWDGYIVSAKKLDAALKDKIIQGVHLSCVGTAVDMWYPYLWMLGGAIVESRPAHPKGNLLVSRYNSTEGVRALDFVKDQVEAGIKPQQKLFDTAFAQNKSFAVMLGGS